MATHSSTLAWRIPQTGGARQAIVCVVPKELDTCFLKVAIMPLYLHEPFSSPTHLCNPLILPSFLLLVCLLTKDKN